MVTALLTAKEDDLILIENPEAHLHPAGQSKLGELIALVAESGVQLFIETHSDHLMNGIRVAVAKKQLDNHNVSLFNFTGNTNDHSAKIEQPYIDERGRLSHWPDGFFDEWENQLDELLNIK